MSKYELNQEQINKILIQANKIGFIDILPILVYDILRVEGQHVGTSVPFMLAPLIAAIGLLLHQSTVSPFDRSRQGICNFTALIAHPSTGKTPALNVIKSAVTKLEEFNGISAEKSALTNSASVEGLLEHLDKISCMLALYDESNTFLGTIGRYSNGSSSALYERSIYLTLFSAAESIERDIKAGRSKIKCPRFHMCLLGHPYFFINLLKQERFSYDDGLFQRFFLLAPLPPIITAEDMRAAPKTIVSIHCIFMFIHMVHFDKKRNYTFTKPALDLIDIEFNKARRRVLIANEFDSYIGAICGKILTHLVRMCMFLKSLTVASNCLLGVIDSTALDLTMEFSRESQRLADNIGEDAFVIEADIVQRAKKLVEYFILHKLILSSYSIDPNGSFDDAFEKICEARPRETSITAQFCLIPNKVLRFMQRSFEIPFTKFNASRLSKNNLYAHEAREVFNRLQNLELGQMIVEKNEKNNQNCTYFQRISRQLLKERPDLGQVLLDMGLNLSSVFKLLEETEAKEKNLIENGKRDRETDDTRQRAPKRPRLSLPQTNTVVNVNKRNSCPYLMKRCSYEDEDYGKDNSQYQSVSSEDESHLSKMPTHSRSAKASSDTETEFEIQEPQISVTKTSKARSSIETGYESNEIMSHKKIDKKQVYVLNGDTDSEKEVSNGQLKKINGKKFQMYEYDSDDYSQKTKNSKQSTKHATNDSDKENKRARTKTLSYYKNKSIEKSISVSFHSDSEDENSNVETKQGARNSKTNCKSNSPQVYSDDQSNSDAGQEQKRKSGQNLKSLINSDSNVHTNEARSSNNLQDDSDSATQPKKSGRYKKRGPYKKTLLKQAQAVQNETTSKSNKIQCIGSDERDKNSSRTKNYTPPAPDQPSQQIKDKSSRQINKKLYSSDDM